MGPCVQDVVKVEVTGHFWLGPALALGIPWLESPWLYKPPALGLCSQDGGNSGLSQDRERPVCGVCTQARSSLSPSTEGGGGCRPNVLTAFFSGTADSHLPSSAPKGAPGPQPMPLGCQSTGQRKLTNQAGSERPQAPDKGSRRASSLAVRRAAEGLDDSWPGLWVYWCTLATTGPLLHSPRYAE